jgi:hypothetical protein
VLLNFKVLGAVELLLQQEESAETQQTWQQIYGVGSQVGVMLPYSRNHETEDKIGLVLMALQDTILIKQFLSGLEWQQVQTVKLHLNFSHPSDAQNSKFTSDGSGS